MKNIILSIYLLIISFVSFSQNEDYQSIKKQFINSYCECLASFKNENPQVVLYDKTEICINQFIAQLDATKTQNLINNDKSISDTLSQFDRNKQWGKNLIFSIIEDLVSECESYRQTILEYKQNVGQQFNIEKQDLNALITEFNSKIPTITIEKNKAYVYTLLGVIYEYNKQPLEALKYYKSALSIYPTTSAKGLKKLIEINLSQKKLNNTIEINLK